MAQRAPKSGPAPQRLRTNRLSAPLGVGWDPLELSWEPRSRQAGYQVRLIDPFAADGSPVLWDSGPVASADPSCVVPSTAGVGSRSAYAWQVRTDDGAHPSMWSEFAQFETGMATEDWGADWIGCRTRPHEVRTLYFRRVVDLPAPVVRARAYASALGWYRLHVNDLDVTGQTLVPRWTPFHERIEYQVYDIAAGLRPGTNVIGIVVAEGRYRGALGFTNETARYGDALAAMAQIELTLADGSVITITTDQDWEVGTGPIRTSDPMNGERVDARIPASEWLDPGLPLRDREPVRLLPSPRANLIAESVERVTAVLRMSATVLRRNADEQIVDFGQNFSGVARVRLHGPAGSTVKLRYSEVLEPNGRLDTSYLSAKKGEWFQTDEVILGEEPLDFLPTFTTHGFRYLSVDGPVSALRDEDVEGVVISTDLEAISEFNASDPRLEQLWRNVVWSLKSNFTDTPTDCPTRERSGWTGDIQIFGPTAAQLVDVDAYLRRYLENVATEQGVDGTVPSVIPAEAVPGVNKRPFDLARTSAGWGDVAVMLPWTLYRYYGDRDTLARQYPSARAWVEFLIRRGRKSTLLGKRGRRHAGGFDEFIVDSGFHWGEWLRPGSTIYGEIIGIVADSRADVATAYLVNSARILADTAEVLGQGADAAYYREVSESARTAWQRAFVRRGGSRISRDRQDDYVRALAFGLLPLHQRAAALARLVELFEVAGMHLQTGFLSTPLLLDTLVRSGRDDIAYRLLLQTTAPSWLGQIERGATTTWETWEGYRRNGRAHESHNHYAFGAVVQFLHESVAGLAPLEPGYRRIRVAPVPGGGLTSAGVTVRTPYGRAASAWEIVDGALRLTATIPPGTSAVIEFGAQREEVGAGRHEFAFPLSAREVAA